MKTNWLHKNNKEKCILFMNGWGCDELPFRNIPTSDYDVLICSDYREILSLKEIDRLFDTYSEIHLLAWSLGVYMANLIFGDRKELFASSIAINGTLTPIDKLKGIPPAIFQGTIDGLDERNLEKFQMRMCGGRAPYSKFKENRPMRTLADQKEELITLQDVILNHNVGGNIFKGVLIGGKDMIFPFENQKKAWKDHKNILEKENFAHFCFDNYCSWDELMEDIKFETSGN